MPITKNDLRISEDNGIITIIYEREDGKVFLKKKYIDYTRTGAIKHFLTAYKQYNLSGVK